MLAIYKPNSDSMAISEKQQILESMKRSQFPLIVLPDTAEVDQYTAAFGLKRLFQKLKKEATIVSSSTLPKELEVHANTTEVYNDIPALHHFIVDVPLGTLEIDDLSYEVVDNTLRIFIGSKSGTIGRTPIKMHPTQYQYDLIICVGAQDLESCKKMYESYADFFYQVPIVNIDHSPHNEYFGHLNAVNVTASACGEVCFELLKEFDEHMIDEEMASHFLMGMISKTKSFRSDGVTPKTLAIASELLEHGADRAHIVRQLYQRRSLATLRLWGRALARLQMDEESKVLWSTLTQQDFLQAGATEDDLPEVVDELMTSSPQADTILLMYENAGGESEVIMRSRKQGYLERIKSFFNTQMESKWGSRFLIPDQPLTRAKEYLFEKLRTIRD